MNLYWGRYLKKGYVTEGEPPHPPYYFHLIETLLV
jgi:hypothetical protein